MNTVNTDVQNQCIIKPKLCCITRKVDKVLADLTNDQRTIRVSGGQQLFDRQGELCRKRRNHFEVSLKSLHPKGEKTQSQELQMGASICD